MPLGLNGGGHFPGVQVPLLSPDHPLPSGFVTLLWLDYVNPLAGFKGPPVQRLQNGQARWSMGDLQGSRGPGEEGLGPSGCLLRKALSLNRGAPSTGPKTAVL